MRRRTVVGSVGAAALGVVGVSAYTSATVSRAASLNVVNDGSASAVLEMSTGPGAELTNGTLELTGNGERLNREAIFEFGKYSDPSGGPAAFSVTNNDNDPYDLTVTLSSSSGHTLKIKGDDETNETVVDAGTGRTYNVASGTSVDFAFRLESAASNADYSGTLTLSTTNTS